MSSFGGGGTADTGFEGGPWSPANFEDADDLRPTGVIFDIAGNGSSTPYTTAINGVINKQISEIKDGVGQSINLPATWKKRLRTFIATKNTDLLDFLQFSVQSHPTLGKGEAILRKFGNVHISPNHASIRDLVLDVSGVNYIDELNSILDANALEGQGSLQKCISIVHTIFDKYREAGEEALQQEAFLKAKLDVLDKIQGKLTTILDLDPTEKYGALMQSTEDYLGTIFEKNQIQESYNVFIEAYRKFITLRDIVMMLRTVQTNENEPTCSVCLNEQIVYVVVPCGHTCCSTCMLKQTGSCFFCRGPIRERQRLYFG